MTDRLIGVRLYYAVESRGSKIELDFERTNVPSVSRRKTHFQVM